MKTRLSELPTTLKQKKLAQLKEDLLRGISLAEFSEEERDLLHMETTEANVLYWKHENEISESSERCIFCQCIMRNIVAALRDLEPPVEDTADELLSNILEEIELHTATD